MCVYCVYLSVHPCAYHVEIKAQPHMSFLRCYPYFFFNFIGGRLIYRHYHTLLFKNMGSGDQIQVLIFAKQVLSWQIYLPMPFLLISAKTLWPTFSLLDVATLPQRLFKIFLSSMYVLPPLSTNNLAINCRFVCWSFYTQTPLVFECQYNAAL